MVSSDIEYDIILQDGVCSSPAGLFVTERIGLILIIPVKMLQMKQIYVESGLSHEKNISMKTN